MFFHLMMVIRSRGLCFTPEDPLRFTNRDTKILSPIVDLLNHSFSYNCFLEGDYSQMSDKSYVLVRSNRDIKAGEELTLNYGNYDTFGFFMRYGFYTKNNPYDFIELDLDHGMLEKYSVVMYDLKFKILRNGPEVDFDRLKLFPNKFEKKYLNSLRIWFLTEQDLVEQPGLASNLYMHFDREVSINNELLVTEYL